ncbi:MAG TPA: hypothetical protein VGR71_09865, partial [Nitrospira sp.]|nr:hypothetical protein [Nitrospira sp.]
MTDLSPRDTRVITFGPNSDRQPKFSPDGRRVAYLSDRHEPGHFELFILDLETGASLSTPSIDGWVEYMHWSPDGARILLGIAGHGADIAAPLGGVATARLGENLPSWIPVIKFGNEDCQWRRAWIYDSITAEVHPVGPECLNVWEAVWCGTELIAAVASPEPGEGHWYAARLHLIDINSGNATRFYSPREQIGSPAASPTGRYLAVVEGACSDRGVLAGDLLIFDLSAGTSVRAFTDHVDIAYTEWRSETTLLLGGHRGFESVVGAYNTSSGRFTQAWSSPDITTAGRYITICGLNDIGDCVLIGESFQRAPELALIRRGDYQVIRTFDHAYADHSSAIGSIERFVWTAPDKLEIQGLLLAPKAPGPHPLIMYVHGGPVGHWRPWWLGRSGIHILMLLRRGY